jgi:hypothetical protein
LDKIIKEINSLEIYWIAQFKTWGFRLTNSTLGGEGGYGRKLTSEEKQKLSKSLRDKYSKESHKLKGRKWSEERKLQRSIERKGKIPTCSMLGKIHKNRHKIACFKGNDFIKNFDSMLEASKELNINVGAISNVCLGKSNTTKGYSFKKISENL